MTREEKQLLFKDLCTRLPYGVVIHTDWKDVKLDRDHCGIGMLYYEHYSEEAKKECGYDENDCSIIISGCYYGDIKPYLRPMSSMTDKEETLFRCELPAIAKTDAQLVAMRMELFLKGHLDFNHLIEKGLALEAPEDMYKTE
jgi:hypothetical protein